MRHGITRFGFVLIAAAVVVAIAPLVTYRGAPFVAGGLLVLLGVLEVVAARHAGTRTPDVPDVFGGIFALGGGLALLFHEVAGLAPARYALAGYLLVRGLFLLAAAFPRRRRRWGLAVLVDGLLAVFFGVCLVRDRPLAGAWALAFYLGVHWLLLGWALVDRGDADPAA